MIRTFVSASVPRETDPICEIAPPDKQAIRDALVAIIDTLLPESEFIWGGAPAITQILAGILCRHGKQDLLKNFQLYQSEFFSSVFPSENALFAETNKHLTDIRRTREESLTLMREQMLCDSQPIDIAIFIGGREEGLSEELGILRRNHPEAVILPLASTGGYAKCIYQRCREESSKGNDDDIIIPDTLYEGCQRYRFYTLFSLALRIAKERARQRSTVFP